MTDLFTTSKTLRLRSLILAMAFAWEPGRAYEGGMTVLLHGTLYRAVRPSWNVYPQSRAGGEFWERLDELD